MKITPRFVIAIKISLLLVIAMSIYSFVLSYYGMSGMSISHPQENTTLRIVLNQVKGILMTVSFWALIGYICKDYKAAIAALMISLAIYFGNSIFFPRDYGVIPPRDLQYYLFSISGVLPILTFGMVHFKSSAALKLIAYWAITWGLSVMADSSGFERMIEGLTRICGLRDPFEIHISTGVSSYRPISIFRIIHHELILIWKLSLFWWVYHIIKTKSSIWDALKTCYDSTALDSPGYSAIYWSFRVFLFVAGLGLMSFIANTTRYPFDVLTILRVAMAACALVVIASVYRNFLISHFTQRNKYPNGLFFLLNIPIINLFAWVYSLIYFNVLPKEESNASNTQDRFAELQANFINESKNSGWKVVIIVLTLISMLFELNRAGFRIDGPGRDGVTGMLLISLVTFSFILWFLYNKHAYIPLVIISLSTIIVVAMFRSEALMHPTMAASLINLVLFYGMFYFDEFRWDGN